MKKGNMHIDRDCCRCNAGNGSVGLFRGDGSVSGYEDFSKFYWWRIGEFLRWQSACVS